MQVKTQGELVTVRGHQLAARRREQILTLEPASIGREHEYALVDHIENVGVTIMRGAQHRRAALLLAREGDLARTGDHRRAVEHAPDRACFAQSARGWRVECNGRMRSGRARDLSAAVATCYRQPTIDHDPILFGRELE